MLYENNKRRVPKRYSKVATVNAVLCPAKLNYKNNILEKYVGFKEKVLGFWDF